MDPPLLASRSVIRRLACRSALRFSGLQSCIQFLQRIGGRIREKLHDRQEVGHEAVRASVAGPRAASAPVNLPAARRAGRLHRGTRRIAAFGCRRHGMMRAVAPDGHSREVQRPFSVCFNSLLSYRDRSHRGFRRRLAFGPASVGRPAPRETPARPSSAPAQFAPDCRFKKARKAANSVEGKRASISSRCRMISAPARLSSRAPLSNCSTS